MKICIVWASRKRHITLDKKLLCETQHKGGYSKGGHYNSYNLDPGVFDKIRTEPDVDYLKGAGAHSEGIIPFLPLDQIPEKVIISSICKKCLKKYEKLTKGATC
jgi:hypothetical protein